MGRKKKSLAARAAQQPSGAEAATTSQQVPAQSGPQTQPDVQASRAQTTQSQTTAQVAPGQTKSRPRAQERAPPQSGPAASTSQPGASFQPQPTVPPQKVRASPPDSGPSFQPAPPGQHLSPPHQPRQPQLPVPSPQPRGWGPPSSSVQPQQSPFQPAPPGQHLSPPHQPRQPQLPVPSPQPRGWGPPSSSVQPQQPPFQPAPPGQYLSPPGYQPQQAQAQPFASPQPRGWGPPSSSVQPHQPPFQPAPPGQGYFSPDVAQQQSGQHTRAPPAPFQHAASEMRGSSRPPFQPATPVQFLSPHGQGEPPIRAPRARGPTTTGQTQPGVWGSSPSPGVFQQPATPGTSSSVAAGAPQQLTPSSGKPSSIETTQSELGGLVLGSEQKSQKKKSTEICRYTIPNKIAGRTVRCQPVNLICNYFPMTLSPTEMIRYDISFKPDKPKKLVKLAYETMKRKLFPKAVMAFDQSKICIVREPLPGVEQRFVTNIEITDENKRTVTFEVTIVHTGVLNFKTLIEYTRKPASSLNPPTEVIQLLDIILRQGTLESYTKAGRQFFKRPHRPEDLGHGLEMWTGLFQSAIITNRMFINVDVAHKGFPKNKNLIDLLREDFRLETTTKIEKQRYHDKFLEFLKGLRVVVPIYSEKSRGLVQSYREFIVNSLQEPPNTESFDYANAEGVTKKITILDYFKQVKGVNIQYPNLNCVWVGPKDKRILYPMELVVVAQGQVRNRQLNEDQLSKMVRTAASPPEVRVAKIKEIIKEIKYSTNPQYRHFGLTINDSNFHTIPGKVLENPKIDNGQRQQPMDGAWNFYKVCNPATFPPWVYLSIECDNNNTPEIIEMIIAEGGKLGMRIGQPYTATVRRREELASCLKSFMGKGCRLAFLVISTQKDIYHHIKTVAECHVGMLTQCLKLNTVRNKGNRTTIKNILLKVNAKLMGINHKIHHESVPRSLSEKDLVMVVGADVTHPSPDQKTVPSIAAVIASINNTHTIYNMEMSIQAARVEIISQFQEMMRDHFEIYKSRNGNLPTKIYVYRDGVSEGQFSQVLNEELTALYNAYRSVGGRQRPNVLFLLVQKRHHTRLFDEARLKNPQLRNRNVVPGTLVDVDIVHPTELDFYMVSHQAIKGTARPTRYHQVYNDLKTPDDEVQQMTHYLCHLFARCSRSVSYPAPTYYAHLACLRARSLTYNTQFNMADLEREPKRLKVHESLRSQSTMFFV